MFAGIGDTKTHQQPQLFLVFGLSFEPCPTRYSFAPERVHKSDDILPIILSINFQEGEGLKSGSYIRL